nr:hypothetical protein [Sneathiella limimaris]
MDILCSFAQTIATETMPFHLEFSRVSANRHIVNGSRSPTMFVHGTFAIGTVGPMGGLGLVDPDLSGMIKLRARRISQSRD